MASSGTVIEGDLGGCLLTGPRRRTDALLNIRRYSLYGQTPLTNLSAVETGGDGYHRCLTILGTGEEERIPFF